MCGCGCVDMNVLLKMPIFDEKSVAKKENFCIYLFIFHLNIHQCGVHLVFGEKSQKACSYWSICECGNDILSVFGVGRDARKDRLKTRLSL